jgi:hypothetical protein
MCVIDILRDNPHSFWLLIDINSFFLQDPQKLFAKKKDNTP